MLSHRYRLGKVAITQVLAAGHTIQNQILSLRLGKIGESTDVNRFAFVVSLKVAKKATERNLLKRRLRAIIRKELSKMSFNGLGVIVFLKPAGAKLTFSVLEKELLSLLNQAKLFRIN